MHRATLTGLARTAAVPFVLYSLAMPCCAAGPLSTLGAAGKPRIVAWGLSDFGLGSIPPAAEDAVAVAAGAEHSVALKPDGTVVVWGKNNVGQADVPAGLRDVVKIACGEHHSLAVRKDGTVVAWGWRNDGRCDVPEGLSDVVEVAGGVCHSLALRRDGTVVAWGNNKHGQSRVPDGLVDAVGISAGLWHSAALRRDGTVVAWGHNEYGQCSVPAGLPAAVAVSAGSFHTTALHANGAVSAWGAPNDGSTSYPKRLSNVCALAGGVCALKRDGTVVQWGEDRDNQTKVPPGLSGVTAIAASLRHSLAIRGKPSALAVAPPPTPAAPVAAPDTAPRVEGDVGPGALATRPDGGGAGTAPDADAGSTPAGLAALRSHYRNYMAQCEADRNAEFDDWAKRYAEDVKAAGIAAQRAGSLEGWQAAVKESDRFATARVVPADPPVDMPAALRALQARYRAAAALALQRDARRRQDLTSKYAARLASLKAEATKAGNLAEAVAYDAELKRVQGNAGAPGRP